jgi:hypothetical protein
MKITAMTDTSDLRERMRVWGDLVGKETSEGLRQFARVACIELITVTQPYSGKNAEIAGYTKGIKAVTADIGKVFYEPSPNGGFVNALSSIVQKSFQKKKNDGKNVNVQAETEKFRARVNGYASANNRKALRDLAERFNWQGVVETIDPQLHKNARTGKRTRVVKQQGKMFLYLGPRGGIRDYTQKIKERVGWAKAGWAACAIQIPLNRKSSPLRDVPKWVKRHKNTATGSIEDLSNDAASPRVLMTNTTPWTSELLSTSQAQAALDIARNKFVKYMNTQIKYELKKQAKLK